MTRKARNDEVAKRIAGRKSFTVGGGAYRDAKFVQLDRTLVGVVSGHLPGEPSRMPVYEFKASRWWKVVDGKRSQHAVVIESTLHKLLTRAANL